jgi:hypothetical protein
VRALSYLALILLIFQIDSAVARQLIDKIYEKRKAAALELEKWLIGSLSRDDYLC